MWKSDDAVSLLTAYQPGDLCENCIERTAVGYYSSVLSRGIQLQPMASLSAQNLFLQDNSALKFDEVVWRGEANTRVIFKSRYQLGKFNHLHNEPSKNHTQCFKFSNLLPLIFDYIVRGEEARFSPSVQTGPGAHTASYSIGTGSFSGVKQPARGFDHTPHVATRLRKK